jgi:hypothetical protein
MEFKLTEVEEARVKEFENALVQIYGETGVIKYIFTPASGLGYAIEIHSVKANTTKDITDYESW